MNDHKNEPFDELMRRALSEEANRIEPADALPEIKPAISITNATRRIGRPTPLSTRLIREVMTLSFDVNVLRL